MLVLASASPRRVALLAQLGLSCTQRPMDVDERHWPGEDPAAYVQRMARIKAEACASVLGDVAGVVVLGADTAVVQDGKVLGKPVSREDALAMLMALSGRWHTVYTGVAVLSSRGCSLRVVSTRVHMLPMSHEQAAAYWASGEPRDKAGAYGIQGLGGALVDAIEGSYPAVVGLPLAETAAMLSFHGIPLWQEQTSGH